ncbi:hypothetical protein H6P81_000756 [Aristolochia fimbriata]|uniref:WD repeat-containing protein 76 n=1 Tax=Aristolochia fimbriata TaxID=158543 RepID=A0AAV7F5A9_ARIFI|nr:hypothetical protein H6P81_000756 [Aristolochia fimbriata]
MPTQALTQYERERLENIRRNGEMMAALKLQHKANELSTAAKRPRQEIKSFNNDLEKKKPKIEAPIVIRRSLRSRGLPPDSSTAAGLEDDLLPSPGRFNSQSSPQGFPVDRSGPLAVKEAHSGGADDRLLLDTILCMSENAPLCPAKKFKEGTASGLNLESLTLKEENVARVVRGRILNVRFLPSGDRTVVIVGDKLGNVGFWDVDRKEGEGDGIYVYSPHSAPVSGISVQPYSLCKIFTSCYDGFLRLMDVGEEKFNVVYSGDEAIFSLSQLSSESGSLYFCEGRGGFKIWDLKTGKASSSFSLHTDRINSIDFNPANTNLVATSSTDGTACIWDLRSIRKGAPKSVSTITHKKAVHSAYFSPSGNYLATTSVDNTVGLASGANFADTTMISHYNQTSRWISSFRAIWGWDDSYIFLGNMKRAVDVISTIDRTTISLVSSHMTAIPTRFAAHPLTVGALAGATAGGQVYLWTSV